MEASGNNDAPELSRVLAPMLSELEDHATRLTVRKTELAREMASVDEELSRVEAVRAAMIGKRGPGRPKKTAGTPALTTSGKQARERADAVLAYARTRVGEEFTGRELAEHLGLPWQGVGPTLAGMTRRGELNIREDPDSRTNLYSLAG